MLAHKDLVDKNDIWQRFLARYMGEELSSEKKEALRTCLNTISGFPVTQKYYEAWWIRDGLYYECVNCEQQFSETSNYCPNCGAKMLRVEG